MLRDTNAEDTKLKDMEKNHPTQNLYIYIYMYIYIYKSVEIRKDSILRKHKVDIAKSVSVGQSVHIANNFQVLDQSDGFDPKTMPNISRNGGLMGV